MRQGLDDARDIFSRDTQYYRLGTRFALNEAFEAVLRYSLWKEAGTGGAAFRYRVGGAFVNPATGAFDILGTPVLLNIGPTELDGIPDVAGRDIGPVTLRSITGHVDYEVFRNADNDFTSVGRNVDAQDDKLSSVSQEIQGASSAEGRFDWILGYYYFKEDIDWSVFSSCPTGARNTAGCAFAAGFPDTTSNAFFGQASYWLIEDRVHVTGVVSYDFRLGGGGTVTPQITLLYSGSYHLTDFNTVLDEQDSFAKVDLRLGWRSENGRYSADAFVNNAGDEVTINRATSGSRGQNLSYDAPRMWGIRIGARF